MNRARFSRLGGVGLFAAIAATAVSSVAAAADLPAAKSAAPRAEAPGVMSDRDLGAVSGGQSPGVLALTNQTLTGLSSGNSVTAGSIQSGAVSFGAGALQGFTGIGNFVINTGNNNILQGNLSVTVVPLH